MPELHIKGVGEIAFPLLAAQAREIIARAEAAPFGRGDKTVYDDSVRKCWQVDAAGFSCKAKAWQGFLKRALDTIGETLGIRGKISAHPYKFLLYGPGGHFKAHQDTEKLDAMFGTLVIAMPSDHRGGQLHIRHDGREQVVDFSDPAHARDLQYAAFFADCEHEVLPVESGYRCCVVCNLRLDEGDPARLNLSLTENSRFLLPALAALGQSAAGDLSAVVLEHAYTEANFALRRLKGNDQARAQALLAAAGESGLEAHLALLTFHRSGDLIEHDYHRSGRGRWDDDDDNDNDDGEMGEIYEESITLSDWRDARDRKRDLGPYHIAPEALVATEDLAALEPDEQEAEGYTGNAGCTMDHWYRRAAIVLWRSEDDEAILCRYNMTGAMAALGKLGKDKKKGPGSPFHRLASAALELCPEKFHLPHHRDVYGTWHTHDHNNPLQGLIAAIAAAGAPDLLDKLVARLPVGGWLAADKAGWDALHQSFGAAALEPVRELLLAENTPAERISLYRALASLAARTDGAEAVCRVAAGLLALGLKEPGTGYNSRRDPRDPGPPPGDPEEAGALLAASPHLTAAKLRKSARVFLEGDSSLAYARGVLGPALLDKPAAIAIKQDTSLVPQLLDHAIAILEQETARPLPPYPDWRRPCPPPVPDTSVGLMRRSPSAPLAELAAFMADPAAKVHTFARRQDERGEIERFIASHRLDLDTVTIAKGSPHQLVATKNDASHRHALAMRDEDRKLLAKLKRLKR